MIWEKDVLDRAVILPSGKYVTLNQRTKRKSKAFPHLQRKIVKSFKAALHLCTLHFKLSSALDTGMRDGDDTHTDCSIGVM